MKKLCVVKRTYTDKTVWYGYFNLPIRCDSQEEIIYESDDMDECCSMCVDLNKINKILEL